MTNTIKLLHCYKCKQEKPEQEYGPFYSWWCLDCMKDYMAELYEQTPPKMAIYRIFKETRNISQDQKPFKIEEFLPKIVEFIVQHEGCDRNDIEKEFVPKISPRLVFEILRKIEKDFIIYSSGRPKKYFITKESTIVLDTENGKGN